MEEIDIDNGRKQDPTEEFALTEVCDQSVDYKNDWIVDLGYSNHMTRNMSKSLNITKYKGDHVILTTDNTQLSIAHVGKINLQQKYGHEEFQF